MANVQGFDLTNPQHLYYIYQFARERALSCVKKYSPEYCSYLLHEDGHESLNKILEITGCLELTSSELLGTTDIDALSPYFTIAFRSCYLSEIIKYHLSEFRK